MSRPDENPSDRPWEGIPEDRTGSPYTGLTRRHWAAVADQLLLALRPHFSPGRARVLPPGQTSSSGTDSDGLEGFARSFLLVGFRIAGERGADPHGFLDWYRQGLITGTDPSSPEAWPRPDVVPQAKVEAASIALILQLTRPWLWDTLGTTEQQRVIDWFATVVGTEYPPNNWLWFRVMVETFLASAGGPYSDADVRADLAFHESLFRAHGWYADGTERNFDSYCGWALHFYPLVWAALAGLDGGDGLGGLVSASDAHTKPWADAVAGFGGADLVAGWRERLSDFLDDDIHLIGADGTPVLQGRSLVYRFAAAAPLWVGAATGATRLGAGALRRAASGILRSSLVRGVPDERGLLTLGIGREWPQMAQTYSGSGSPYWAAKGMFGLVLPADHPVWTATEEPLPLERGDDTHLIEAPGWIVSGTEADGIVRLINHGTDHALAGDDRTDAPLYARFGYSSATFPLVGVGAVAAEPAGAAAVPADNAAVLLDGAGRASHRAGLELSSLDASESTAVAISRAHPHWVDLDAGDGLDHGAGRSGTVTWGPHVTTASAVHGEWELRMLRIDTADAAAAVRITGWPLAADSPEELMVTEVESGVDVSTASGRAEGEEPLHSELRVLVPYDADVEVARIADASALGDAVALPQVTVKDVPAGFPVIVAVRLGAAPAAVLQAEGWDVLEKERKGRARPSGSTIPRVELAPEGGGHRPDGGHTVSIHWPDRLETTLTLPAH